MSQFVWIILPVIKRLLKLNEYGRIPSNPINKKFKAKRAKQILDGDAVVLAKVQGQKDRANERKSLARIESKRQVDAGNIDAIYKKTEQKAKKADSG